MRQTRMTRGRAPPGNPAPALPRWEPLLEHLPAGVHLYDLDGRLVRANRRAAEIAAEGLGEGVLAAALSGGADLGGEEREPPVREVLRRGEAVRDREVSVTGRDGTRVHLLTNADLVLNAKGTAAGAVVCFQSINGIRQARTDLRKERVWARRMFETSPVAVYWTDPEGRIRSFNPAAEVLWGRRPAADERWCAFQARFHPDGRAMGREESPLAAAVLRGQAAGGRELAYERPDGLKGSVISYPTPLYDEGGRLVGAINMLVDITERRLAEERQKVLLDELNHRVKNTLATVQSLAGQSFRGDSDPAAMAAAFEARLLALSKAHDQLAQRHWNDADLKSLAMAVLSPVDGARLTVDGEPTRISPRAAVTIAMGLHELAANAERFGALSTPTGKLRVGWATDAAGALVLTWRESAGPAVSPPQRRGFGRRFLEAALSRELGGRADLDFAPDGLSCTLRLPAWRQGAPADA
ncbi:MAG: sensor histidine kinase [Phenylobacterium sp.]|uniref:sensor histidine kinase n=1 Tax=Phenylobacterium sp. TaxID=1871053 RepID=UPI00391A517E